MKERDIPEGDKDIILSYINYRISKGKVSEKTGLSMATYFLMLQRKTGPLDNLTTDLLLDVLRQFRAELAPTSFDRMRAIVITFVSWLVTKRGSEKIDLIEIKDVEKSKENDTNLKPSDMLEWKEINKMVGAAESIRDKTIILLLFESALRPTELCNLKWQDLDFIDNAVVITKGRKTKRERRVLCVKAEPWLKTYREIQKNTGPDDWVFPSRTKGKKGNQPLTHWGLQPIIKNSAKAAGLEGVYPYLMRHSRITNLVDAGVQESVVKLVAWGHLNSQMLPKYVHLSGKKIDNAIRKIYGDIPEENKKTEEMAPSCPICGEKGLVGAKFCHCCGASYDGSIPSSKLEIMQENQELRTRLDALEKQSAEFATFNAFLAAEPELFITAIKRYKEKEKSKAKQTVR